MKRRLEFTIPPRYDGVRLADFLADRFAYHSSEAWARQVRAGRVTVNARQADPSQALARGDRVEYRAEEIPEPPVAAEVDVLFEDEDLLVVDKPANLPTHPGGRYFNHTLWAVLKTRHGVAAPVFVSRLDRETSGVLLVAKHPRAAAACRRQFERRTVAKRYTALVEGAFPDALHARGFLIPDPASPVRKRLAFAPAAADAPPPPDGVPAETRFARRARHGAVSEIEVLPATGRTHQIRATLHSLGFPVVGDKLYGPDPGMFLRFCEGCLTDEDRRCLRMDRQALHAAALRFRHPRDGRELELTAPLPADMTDLIRRLDAGA